MHGDCCVRYSVYYLYLIRTPPQWGLFVWRTYLTDIAASHKTRLGCSKLAQALGVSRWGTALQLWEQYVGISSPPNISGETRVALGVPMEDVLKPFVEKRLGRELRRDRKAYTHPTLPLIGHVDFRASTLDGETIRPIVDIKTSLGYSATKRFADDYLDPDVEIQMHGYMLLTGAELAFVAALIPGPEIKLYTIPANPGMSDQIADGIREFFWHVENRVPPKAETLDDAERLYPNSDKEALTASPRAIELLTELHKIRKQQKELQTQSDALELAIKNEMKESEALIDTQSRVLCTWKVQARKALDTARLKAEQPDLVAQFTKEIQSRVFLLKGTKP